MDNYETIIEIQNTVRVHIVMDPNYITSLMLDATFPLNRCLAATMCHHMIKF